MCLKTAEAREMRRNKMRKISGVRIIVMCLLLSLLSCQKTDQNEEVLEESSAATPVKIFVVKRAEISERLFNTGLIQAWKEITITPDIGGKIDKIHVEEGDMVKQGQLLAELDTRAFRLQLERAEAGVMVAEANLEDAKRNMDRMERLNAENAVSEQQYEKIKLLYKAAGAQLQQAVAVLNLANHNIEVSRMRAPFNGVVASLNAEVGDVINPMMGGFFPNEGILTLMDYSRIKIEVEASQRDASRIEKGQLTRVEVAAFPGRAFPGRVSLVNQMADPQSKKFSVVVVLENQERLLKPNTFGDVTFIIGVQKNVLVIPPKAVLEKSYVFIVQGETVKKVSVTLGFQNQDFVEVTSGLKEGDRVIIEGNFGLEEGTHIDVLEVIK